MKKVLEIGCGRGFNSYILSKSYDVTGIDISVDNINFAKNKYPNIGFEIMNSEKMDFNNETFDKVYAMDILEHVDNLDAVLNEVQRVLKPGGMFVINIPFYKSEMWLLKIRPTYFKEIHHVRIFQKNELKDILIQKNFKLQSEKRLGFLQHFELYFLFKRKSPAKTQLGIGTWRDTFGTKLVHVIYIFFDPIILQTPLKYLPIWIITLPVGLVINYFGNKIFPKSIYYNFQK